LRAAVAPSAWLAAVLRCFYGLLSAARYARTLCARGCPTWSRARIMRTRGHPPGRYLTRELLSSLHPQPTIARSARWFRPGRRTGREPARADDHHEQLVRTDQRDRRPRSHNRTRGPMAKAVRNVGRERRGNPQAQQPSRQRRNPHLPPRRVEHHHRAGVDQPVHRQRHQPTRPPRLAVRPDQRIGVLVGRDRSDSRDTDYRPRGRPPNDPIGRRHRTPPSTNALVRAISRECAIGRPWSSDTNPLRMFRPA
jgi:hypothetical protein